MEWFDDSPGDDRGARHVNQLAHRVVIEETGDGERATS